MLTEKPHPKTKEKSAFEIRQENRLKIVNAETEKIKAETEYANYIIRLVLTRIDDIKDEEIKKKLKSYKAYLNNKN